MEIRYSKRFIKELKKCPRKIQDAFLKRLEIFVVNPFDIKLNNHALHGKMLGLRTINITGNWRAVFTAPDNYNFINFLSIGTHGYLY